MTPRQARRERREAERKAKKLELKKGRLAEEHPLAAVDEFPEIQPRWNPELEDEFPKEIQIRNNAIADRISLQAGLPIPPPGPSPTFHSIDDLRQHLLARRNASKAAPPASSNEIGFVSQPPANSLSHPEEQPHTAALPSQSIARNNTGLVSQLKSSRAEINRANSQLSTGPRTSEGKLASSRNSTKHGLASGQVLIPGEDPAAFESLLNNLLDEHQPATPTETLLIEDMAKSHWLTQRAIRLQNDCFTADGVDAKQLALFLRYQTTHQGAFYKALSALLKLKKSQTKQEIGFVSQRALQTSENTGFVSQTNAENPGEVQFVSPNRLSNSSCDAFESADAA